MIRSIRFFLLASALMAACRASTNDPVPAAADKPGATSTSTTARPAARTVSAPAPTPEPIVIPEGTAFTMTLETTASSATSHEGDTVVAKLTESIRVDDRVVVPSGSEVRGRVTAAVPSGRVKGRARLALDFDSIVVRGREVAIDAESIDVTAKSAKKRDAAIVGGGAGAGAIIGGIINGGKGAAIGALVGAGAGGGTVLATKGYEVQLPSGTALKVHLTKPVRVG
jgi:hypothetical protein